MPKTKGEKKTKQYQRENGLYQRSFVFEGKRHYVYASSLQELGEKEHRKRAELEEGKQKREHPTLDQYHEKWTDWRRETIKESTLRCQSFQYKACAEVKVRATRTKLGSLFLDEIEPDDIKEVQKALLAGGRKTQTVNDDLSHLSHIFHDAIRERLVDYNPCVCIRPLKRKEARARDTTHRALSLEEQERFFSAAKESYYYDVYRFGILTGMRIGEIGALLVSDIRGGMMHIERTITKNEVGGYEIGETAKTDCGRRTIPLNDDIREVIDHQKELNRMLDGEIISLSDRIFKAPERGLLMSTPVNREIKRICKRTGVEYFQFHAFRATFATRAIESGMNPRTLQELLGHSDFGITMNLYGHVLDHTKVNAMQGLHIAINQ